MLTAGATKLSNGVDKALMEVSCPAEARLRVGCEDQTRVATGPLTIAASGWHLNVFLAQNGFTGLNQSGKHWAGHGGGGGGGGSCKVKRSQFLLTFLGS